MYTMGEVFLPSMQEASRAFVELAKALHDLDIEDDAGTA